MDTFWYDLKDAWADMLEPPWRHSGPDDERVGHWFAWLAGWAWAIAGLAFGALYAPSILQSVGLSDTGYQDWLVIGFAVLVGFLVQFLGWCLMTLPDLLHVDFIRNRSGWIRLLFIFVALALFVSIPLAAVGYGIYRYLTWVGASQGVVTVGFVGGLLIKTFAIPLIKSIVTGALFKWFMRWLRGSKTKSA
jgi:hypothetical protein